MRKAKIIYDDMDDNITKFEGSTGWLTNFMKRKGLSVRRKTSIAQKEHNQLIDRLIAYILLVRRLKMKYNYQLADIIVMDGTPIWSDMVSERTVDSTGAKSVSMKTTGHEKSRVSVCVAAKADGTKLQPMIVFKGAKREVETLNKEFRGRCVVASSVNAWMDTPLTHVWIDNVVGAFSFRRRLLAWDSYECHIEPRVKSSLKAKQIDDAIVPGGCTKYIQLADVCLNKLIKDYATERYDEWLATVGINNFTEAGNLRAPPRKTIAQWVLAAWDQGISLLCFITSK